MWTVENSDVSSTNNFETDSKFSGRPFMYTNKSNGPSVLWSKCFTLWNPCQNCWPSWGLAINKRGWSRLRASVGYVAGVLEWRASVGKVCGVLTRVAYENEYCGYRRKYQCGMVDVIMGGVLFLKLFPTTYRKTILLKATKGIQVLGHIHIEHILFFRVSFRIFEFKVISKLFPEQSQDSVIIRI